MHLSKRGVDQSIKVRYGKVGGEAGTINILRSPLARLKHKTHLRTTHEHFSPPRVLGNNKIDVLKSLVLM